MQYNCVTPNQILFLDNVFLIILCICVDILHHHGEFDSLVLELQQLCNVVLLNGKQQFLCWQLPNVMILHMAIKLSRHQCECFAFSHHR